MSQSEAIRGNQRPPTRPGSSGSSGSVGVHWTAWVQPYAYSQHIHSMGAIVCKIHSMGAIVCIFTAWVHVPSVPSDAISAIRCHHVRVRTLYRIDAARRTNDKRVPHGIVRIAGQRLRHRGERLRLVLGCEAHLMREALRRTQTHSDALRRSQMQSLAISASALSSPAR